MWGTDSVIIFWVTSEAVISTLAFFQWNISSTNKKKVFLGF